MTYTDVSYGCHGNGCRGDSFVSSLYCLAVTMASIVYGCLLPSSFVRYTVDLFEGGSCLTEQHIIILCLRFVKNSGEPSKESRETTSSRYDEWQWVYLGGVLYESYE